MKGFKKYWIVLAIVFVVFSFIKPVVCFLLAGAIIFYVCINTLLLFKYIKKKGLGCTGNILSFEEDHDNNKTPLIEFKTLAGELIKAQPCIYTIRDTQKMEKEVSVIYHPDHPQKFILADEKNPYAGLTLGLLLSTTCIVISICVMTGYVKFN